MFGHWTPNIQKPSAVAKFFTSHPTLSYKTPYGIMTHGLKIFALNHWGEAVYLVYLLCHAVLGQTSNREWALHTETQLGSKSWAEQLPLAVHSCLEPCGPCLRKVAIKANQIWAEQTSPVGLPLCQVASYRENSSIVTSLTSHILPSKPDSPTALFLN